MSVPQATQPRLLTADQWAEFIGRQGAPLAGAQHRRRALRHPVHGGFVRLTYRQHGHAVSYTTALIEVSAVGLMLKTPRSIPGETDVQIEILTADEPCAVLGRVIHSTQTVGGYKSGVELTFPKPTA